MNDLEQLRNFRAEVTPPDAERVAAARAKLLAEFDEVPGRHRGHRIRVPRRRRSVTRRPVLAALLAAPAVVAAAAFLIAGAFGGGGTPVADAAIIRHADAALTAPPHSILHTKVVGNGFVAETWQLTSPPYSFLGYKGPVGAAAIETAGDATTASYYDPATNTIHVTPSAAPPPFDDPLSQVRQALDDGRARVLGSAEVDGAATYKIQFAEKGGFSSQSLVAYVDQHTYRPVLLSDPQRDGTVAQLRVVTQEYLQATAANLRSLSLSARHPAAQVVTDQNAKSWPVGK